MKTNLTSNLKPLVRAFYAFLIAFAVLWPLPRNASAQLYVTHTPPGGGAGVVSTYNATTGALIDRNFITGLNHPFGLALSGTTLFVANTGNGTIGKYNATTGTAIHPHFIAGLAFPEQIAVSNNRLFVADARTHTVGVYDATTGVPINAHLINTGLSTVPEGLALSGNTLYVATLANSSRVGIYNATTGAAINANFIPDLRSPFRLLLSGNVLFVADYFAGTISEYRANSGALIQALKPRLTDPAELGLLGNVLFVSNTPAGTVGKYNVTTGAAINAHFITGLGSSLVGIAVK